MKKKAHGKNTPIRPSLNEEITRKMIPDIDSSIADMSVSIKNTEIGRVVAQEYVGQNGSKEYRFTSVPTKNFKRNNIDDIKTDRANGKKVEEIALKYGVSVSYIYKLLKE